MLIGYRRALSAGTCNDNPVGHGAGVGSVEEVLGGVDVLRGNHVDRTVAHIIRGHQPVLPNLSLNVQIPLVHVYGIEVAHFRVDVGSVGEKWNVVVVYANALKTRERRHGISARSYPGIGEIRTGDVQPVSEWRGEVHLSSSEHHRPVSVHSVRRADGHAAFALGIPGQSNPRIEFRPPRAVKILSTGILRIAWKEQPRWSVHEYFAVNVLGECRHIEVLVFAPVVVGRQIRLPSHAIIQRQPRVNLPTVLRIQRIVKLPGVEPVTRALRKGRGKSHKKISKDRSGHTSVCRSRTIERRCAHAVDAGPIIQPLLENRSAEPELM